MMMQSIPVSPFRLVGDVASEIVERLDRRAADAEPDADELARLAVEGDCNRRREG